MFLIVTMAIALSLDAFSVSLILGIIELDKKKHLFYSLLVGVLHFFMPSLGALTNKLLFGEHFISGNKLLGITLLILAISMIIDINKDKNSIGKSNIVILALSVSVDSYFAGLGLKSMKPFSILYFLVFSLFSCIISFAGCKLGKIAKDKLGKESRFLAIILLIILSVKYILFN